MGSASVVNGQVACPGVSLPAGLFGSGFTSVSIEMWVTTGTCGSQPTAWAKLFEWGAFWGSESNVVFIGRNDVSQMLMAGFPGSYIQSPVFFNNQNNLHIVLVLTPGDVARLYVNGVSAANSSAVVTSIPQPNVFYLGASIGEYGSFSGWIDEFRIWIGTLSAVTIAKHHAIGPGNVFG